MEWFSYVIAIGVGLSAILSPWLVTKENNKHQLSLKKFDIFEESKRKVLSDFIKASANLHFNNTIGAIDNFHLSVNCLYIYFKNVPNTIENLVTLRSNNDFFDELNKIVQELSEQISKE